MTRSSPGSAAAVPFTEGILRSLPGNRVAWAVVWALVPWLNLAVVLSTQAVGWTTPTEAPAEVINRGAVTFSLGLSLWGAARIGTELARLRPALVDVVEQELPEVERLFRGIDSAVVPLLLTAAVAVVLPVDEALRGDPLAAAIQIVTWLVIGIPLSTAVWVYLTLQLGLHRLGRGHLTLKGYSGDRTLGLEPVGRLAFTGFWMLLGAVTPVVLASSNDLPSVLVGTVVLLVGIVLFFLSLYGLHRQMVAVKRVELARTRGLYQQAYDEVLKNPTLAVLERRIGLLNAAESLEKRAERIHAWPFAEGTFARTVTIASSAAATIVARILLAPTGL